MPRTIALFAAVAAALVTGNILSQEDRQPSATAPSETVRPATEPPGRAEPVGEELRLTDDAITKEAIERLAGGKWRKVELSGSRIDASVIEALRHANSIRTLALYGGRFSGQIPRLQNVKGLVELTLAGSLDGYDLEAIGELTPLECLKLPQNITINVLGAREIARLTNLKSLDLYNVNIDDAGLAELSTLVNLEKLDLTHTRVTDEGLKVLTHIPKLKTLELYRHPRWRIKQQISNICLAVIGRLTDLERLSLSGTISNEGLPQLARLRKLKHFSILGTEITAAGLGALEDSSIESLMLTPDQLGHSRGAMASLRKLKTLKYVWVFGKFISEEFMKECTTEFPDISWGWHS